MRYYEPSEIEYSKNERRRYSVTFDLELGPTLSCLFPQFPLYPFEAENMFVLFRRAFVSDVRIDILTSAPSLLFLILRNFEKGPMCIRFA